MTPFTHHGFSRSPSENWPCWDRGESLLAVRAIPVMIAPWPGRRPPDCGGMHPADFAAAAQCPMTSPGWDLPAVGYEWCPADPCCWESAGSARKSVDGAWELFHRFHRWTSARCGRGHLCRTRGTMRLNINPNRTRRSCGVSVSIQPPALLSILKVKTIAIVPPTDLRSHGALYSPISRMAQAPKYSCGFPCFARLIRGWHNSYQQVCIMHPHNGLLRRIYLTH